MSKGKVLVVDDEQRIRTLLKMYLHEHEYTVFTAQDGREALNAVFNNTPHIIALDILLPDMDGFEVCKRIRQVDRFSQIPIIYLSSLQESESIITGLEVGGDDYITKPFDPNVLIARINAVLRRTQGNITEVEPQTLVEIEQLSPQELQILNWIEKGFTNKEIAAKLNLTEGTIKVYNYIIFQKLQVKNRTQAIVRAKEYHLI